MDYNIESGFSAALHLRGSRTQIACGARKEGRYEAADRLPIRTTKDGLVHLLRMESMSKGVKVRYHDDATVSIELHIIVDNGVNLTAVSRSIMSEVKYNVSRLTGVEVRGVDVFIDSMVIG